MSAAPYQLQMHALGYSAATASPATYVPLPRCLMEDLRNAPVALGTYALLARLYQISGTSVYLSPGDLQLYDPALSYGSARRAIERLVENGYAVVVDSSGRKISYLPSWGMVDNAPRPWDRAAPSWARPRHITALRLDDRLLDLCMGRLRPHAIHPAVVERYVAAPMVSLRDIGAYARALAGIPTRSTTLKDLGLFDRDNQTLPLPDDSTILAIASQRAVTDATGGLTAAGWRRAGFTVHAPPPPAGQALFFAPTGTKIEDVSANMIEDVSANMIEDMIGLAHDDEAEDCAQERAKSTITSSPSRSHGSTEDHGENPPAVKQATTEAKVGGGKKKIVKEQQPDQSAPSLSESTRLLRSIGVRTDVAAKLADRPANLIQNVIAQAHARKDVRNIAAWVVSVLRTLPAAEEISPAPQKVSERAILFHPTISGYDRMHWLAIFRSAAIADRPAVLARFHAQHPTQDTSQDPTQDASQDPTQEHKGVIEENRAEKVDLALAPQRVSERAILFHPTISGYDRMRWLTIFRSAAIADRPAVLARFHAQHPEEVSDAHTA